ASAPQRAVRLAPALGRQRASRSRLLDAAGPGPDVVSRQVRGADPARPPDRLERAGPHRRRDALARRGETARHLDGRGARVARRDRGAALVACLVAAADRAGPGALGPRVRVLEPGHPRPGIPPTAPLRHAGRESPAGAAAGAGRRPRETTRATADRDRRRVVSPRRRNARESVRAPTRYNK